METDFTLYAAPLQGLTGRVWRTAHARVFGGVDCYLSPFLRMEGGAPRRQGLRDVAPADNTGYRLLPQVLAGPPQETVALAAALAEMGYDAVNLNLGCPHPPVARKGRGAGLLARPADVALLVEALIAALPQVRFSVKMRLGWDEPRQWADVLTALRPLRPAMVAMHPRLGTQQYDGPLLADAFADFLLAASASGFAVVYNGGVTSLADVVSLRERYPSLAGVMIGRGLVALPSLACMAIGHNRARYLAFHEALFEGYRATLTGGDHQVLTHLQAQWACLLPKADRKLHKAIAKSRRLEQFDTAVRALVAAYDFAADTAAP